MNKWLIVHSLHSYKQNPNMIGFANMPKSNQPIQRVREMRAGDKIVYYCRKDAVITGIFEIIKKTYMEEQQWENSPHQFNIKPVIVPKKAMEFRPLIPELNLFKHLLSLNIWGTSIQGVWNAAKRLDDHDYMVIEKALKKLPQKRI